MTRSSPSRRQPPLTQRLHQLLTEQGADIARQDEALRPLVPYAQQVMTDEERSIWLTHAAFCVTALPHSDPGESDWMIAVGSSTLIVESGKKPVGNDLCRVGVPFGANARLIMLYLQTEAVKNRSCHVELGSSMRNWLDKIGVAWGGNSHKGVIEQCARLSFCKMSIHYTGDTYSGFQNLPLVDSGILFHSTPSDERQGTLNLDVVRISDKFYQELIKHPVPLLESAIKAISGKALAIDIYCWLAYRLHVLSTNTLVSWPSLRKQFAAKYRRPTAYKTRFLEALQFALAVYPEARVDILDEGLLLRPSPPPIEKRTLVALPKISNVTVT